MPPPRLSIVLPAFRLEPVIYQNLFEVVKAVEGLGTYEVIVVDDGSPDRTGDEARRAAAQLPTVTVLTHPQNRGKGQALTTGAARATGEIVVFIDADLDLPPEQIEMVLAELPGNDIVVGAKRTSMSGGSYPAARRVLSRTFALGTAALFRLPVEETQTGLKAFRREVLDRVLPELRLSGYAFDLELLVRANEAGFKMREIPVELGPSAASAGLRRSMLWDLGRDTGKLFWWKLTRKL